MRTISLALALLVAACSFAPRPRKPSGDVALTVGGKVESGPFQFGAADLAGLPRRAFQARHPPTGRVVAFEGISLAVLLADHVAIQEKADTVVVRSRDGYAVPIPLVLVKQWRPILADRADGLPLAEWAVQSGARTAPFLLAWPNVDNPGLATEPRLPAFWAGGVDGVDLAIWRTTWGKAVRAPPGTGDAARLGADAFVYACMTCHRLRGVGGERGPDLTRALKGIPPDAFAARMRPHLLATAGPRDPALEGDALGNIARFLAAVEEASTAQAGAAAKAGDGGNVEEEIEPDEPTPERAPPRRR